MATTGDAKVEITPDSTESKIFNVAGNESPSKLEKLKADLQLAVNYCLSILSDGSPLWPAYANQKAALEKTVQEQIHAFIAIRQADTQLSCNRLCANNPTLSQSEVQQILVSNEFLRELCRNQHHKCVDVIVRSKTATDIGIAYLVFYMIKTLYPHLQIQTCNMNNYAHDFILVKDGELEMAIDLVAFGFGKPVIYPKSDLTQNLTALRPHLIHKSTIPGFTTISPNPSQNDVSYRVNLELPATVKLIHSKLVDGIVAGLQKQAEQRKVAMQEEEARKAQKLKKQQEANEKTAREEKERPERDRIISVLNYISEKRSECKESWVYHGESNSYRVIIADKDKAATFWQFLKDNGITITNENNKGKKRLIIKNDPELIAKIKILAKKIECEEGIKISPDDVRQIKNWGSCPAESKITEPLDPTALFFLSSEISEKDLGLLTHNGKLYNFFLTHQIKSEDLKLLTANPRLFQEVTKEESQLGKLLVANPTGFFHFVKKRIAIQEAKEAVVNPQTAPRKVH